MRPYYFDFEPQRTRKAMAILSFERTVRGRPWPPRGTRLRAAETLRALLALVRLWRARCRQRAQLARLDARLLRDIGVTPADAEREINKPFWQG